MPNWKMAFEEALDALSEIPHPMADEAVERLAEEYLNQEDDNA